MGEVSGYYVVGKIGIVDKFKLNGGYYEDKVINIFVLVFFVYDLKYVLVVILDEFVEIMGEELCCMVGWMVVFVVLEIIGCVVFLLGLLLYVEFVELIDIILVVN